MNFSNMSYKDIKSYLDKTGIQNSFEYVSILKSDNRKTVKNLGLSIENSYKKIIFEEERINKMMEFEKALLSKNYNFIAGLDEVGRGPLAGPVVAAAVILPPNTYISDINDSKKLSAKKREELFHIISNVAIDIGIGVVDNKTIDKINILNATKLAMTKAVNSLKYKKPDFMLIDALNLTDINIEQKSIIKGDSRSISIAAASIIAKVTRDNFMIEYSHKYPQYGFDKHKGYGTDEHYNAIRKSGITNIHRKSFLKSIVGE